MKRKRPVRHYRRIKTRKGIKKILVNPKIKRKRFDYSKLSNEEKKEVEMVFDEFLSDPGGKIKGALIDQEERAKEFIENENLKKQEKKEKELAMMDIDWDKKREEDKKSEDARYRALAAVKIARWKRKNKKRSKYRNI